jgi:hypothetical protein
MRRELRLTLSVRIFEQLAAEADAANIPSVELVRRFISARYEQEEAVSAGSAGALTRPARGRSSPDLEEGDAILWCAIDAYGRIVQTLDKILTTVAGRRQLAAIGKDLHILGDGISLLRELLDLVEELREACGSPDDAKPQTMPHAANDHELPD